MIFKYIVEDKYKNKPIKDILRKEFDFSTRLINKLKVNSKILCNNNIAYINDILNEGDIIIADLNFEEDSNNIVPTEMELNIVYEDEYMLIIDKPPYLPVHPSCRYYDTSLSNGVKYYFDKIGLKKKIRPVNRLDKDTSGLVIFAKSEYIQECFIKQMKSNTFKKEYFSILEGILDEKTGTINLPIARKDNSIIERCINPLGDASITHYDVIKEFKNYSLVHFVLETGRTHQIRVHSSAIGHPILGDSLYGAPSPLIDRQALHCYKLTFIHPITKELLSFATDLPNDINKLI